MTRSIAVQRGLELACLSPDLDTEKITTLDIS